MKSYEVFHYKDAERFLESRGLLEEVKYVIANINTIKHSQIQALFESKGWMLEYKIFENVSWAWDAFKDNVAVSIELSLIDAVHRDFLRAMLAHKRGELDALVYVTSTAKEPKYANVLRDLKVFSEMLDFPILLIGLEP